MGVDGQEFAAIGVELAREGALRDARTLLANTWRGQQVDVASMPRDAVIHNLGVNVLSAFDHIAESGRQPDGTYEPQFAYPAARQLYLINQMTIDLAVTINNSQYLAGLPGIDPDTLGDQIDALVEFMLGRSLLDILELDRKSASSNQAVVDFVCANNNARFLLRMMTNLVKMLEQYGDNLKQDRVVDAMPNNPLADLARHLRQRIESVQIEVLPPEHTAHTA